MWMDHAEEAVRPVLQEPGCRILRVPAEHMLRALERERSWLNYIHTQTGKT